ncbi:TetR/AcrR family transcriptional regulator [Streptomyces sp. NPDC057363]|uniref:TetR/AcrR family transcriptional regulator n=1 Tax=Streptomyces sp. NPDC057363 TaxID=3346107 RepID=UPI00363A0DB6
MNGSGTDDRMTRAARGGRASRRGRPRDTDIDERILAAAKAVYAERGRSGFNFETVARRAQVSKDAIYRRYGSQVDLLTASWPENEEAHRHELALPADVGIRDYLIAVAKDHFVTYTRETRLEYLRVYIEAKHNPELLDALHLGLFPRTVSRARGVVRSAMSRGSLPLAPSANAVIDAIIGGVAMHVMTASSTPHTELAADGDARLSDLVDMVLRGCGYGFAANGADAAPGSSP